MNSNIADIESECPVGSNILFKNVNIPVDINIFTNSILLFGTYSIDYFKNLIPAKIMLTNPISFLRLFRMLVYCPDIIIYFTIERSYESIIIVRRFKSSILILLY